MIPLFVVSTAVTAVTADSILVNPSFESGTVSWTCSTTLTVDTNEFHDGTQSVKISAIYLVSYFLYQNLAGINGGTGNLTFSAYVKGSSQATAFIEWYETDSYTPKIDGTHYGLTLDTQSDWTMIIINEAAPANAAYAIVGITVRHAGAATIYIDDCDMYGDAVGIPEFSPPILMLLAPFFLIMLVVAKNKRN